MTDQQPSGDALKKAREALRCLRLELPHDIWNDVNEKCETAFSCLEAALSPRREPSPEVRERAAKRLQEITKGSGSMWEDRNRPESHTITLYARDQMAIVDAVLSVASPEPSLDALRALVKRLRKGVENFKTTAKEYADAEQGYEAARALACGLLLQDVADQLEAALGQAVEQK